MLKKAGIAVMAMVALTASIGAASASAITIKGEPPQFYAAGSGVTMITGAVSGDVFTAPHLDLNCGTTGIQSEIRGYSPILPALPSYSECSMVGSIPKVDMNGCFYVYDLDAVPTEMPYAGIGEIRCYPGGGPILITEKVLGVSICTVSIPKQTVATMSFNSSTGTVSAETNTSKGIEYTVSSYNGESAYCGGAADGTYKDGVLNISGAFWNA
jgi:hypothetical protein